MSPATAPGGEPVEVDLLVDGGTIVTVDRERRIFADGAVAIDGNRIVAVGRRADMASSYRPRRVVDGRNRVVTPGLVQTHVHVSTEQAVKGALPDTMPPSSWVRHVTRFYAATSPHEEEVIAAATFVDLLTTGTTCFIEAGTTKHTPEVVRAMGSVGIRGCIGKWTWDVPREPENLYETTAEGIASSVELIERFDRAHGDRVRVWMTPIGHTMTSDALLQGLKDVADRYGTGMTMHLSSWLEDVEGYLARTGRRPVEYYDELGVLGPNVVLAHMVNLSDEEIEIVLERGARIAHCPTTAGWFGYGLGVVSRFPEMLARGAVIGLGCDAGCCSHNLDVVRAMYSSAVIFRDARRSMDVMSAEQMLEMATLHGARCALQEDSLGSIEAGKKADLVLFDATRPEWRPLHNPVANLVFAADGHSVDTVIVDGVVVCERGRITTVDEEALYDEVEAIGRSVLDRVGWVPPVKWPVIR
jgi:cytosine/adenosine deaminase-related metal-dependent hydrolase